VLVAVATLFDVTRVLELGAGHYSTPAFLNREAFPSLTHLDSLEDDPRWAEEIAAQFSSDSRLHLKVVDRGMAGAASQAASEEYDLIFIDNAVALPERVATISAVAAEHGRRELVLIHDFEYKEYRQAASPFSHRYAFDAFLPQVGAVWNDNYIRQRTLRKLNRRIRSNAGTLSPADVSSWVAIFRPTYRSPTNDVIQEKG